MKDPVRLWADPEAPADLRVDLHRAAKAQASFDAEDGLARLLVAVAAAKTATGAASAGAAANAANAGGAATGKGLAVLLGKGAYWGLATVGAASVLVAVSIGRGGDPPAVTPSASAPIAATPAAVGTVAPGAQPSAEPVPDVPSAEPATSAPAEPTAAAPSATTARAPVPPGSARRLLAEEVKHLAAMRERLGERPADVLAEADRGAPGSALAQEREALAVEALVRLGRGEEARARAAAFVARYPTSPLAPRMRALAGG